MAERQNLPRLNIPASSIREPQYVRVQLLYDDPHEYVGEEYTTWYYNVTDLTDGIDRSIAAYSGLHNAIKALGVGKGDVISIAKVGTGPDTRWDVEAESRVERSASPAPTTQHQPNTARASAGPPVYTPFTEDDVEIMMLIAEHELGLLEGMLAIVETKEAFTDVSLDQKVRIATGMLINTRRVHKPGMVFAVTEENVDAQFIGRVTDLVAAGMPTKDAIMTAIAETMELDGDDLIAMLVKVGVKSTDINDNDPDGWTRLLNITRDAFAGWGQDELSEKYGLDSSLPF